MTKGQNVHKTCYRVIKWASLIHASIATRFNGLDPPNCVVSMYDCNLSPKYLTNVAKENTCMVFFLFWGGAWSLSYLTFGRSKCQSTEFLKGHVILAKVSHLKQISKYLWFFTLCQELWPSCTVRDQNMLVRFSIHWSCPSIKVLSRVSILKMQG